MASVELAPVDRLPVPLPFFYVFDGSLDVARLRGALDTLASGPLPLLRGRLSETAVEVTDGELLVVEHAKNEEADPRDAGSLQTARAQRRTAEERALEVHVTALRGGNHYAVEFIFDHRVLDAHSFFAIFFRLLADVYSGRPVRGPDIVLDRNLMRPDPSICDTRGTKPEEINLLPIAVLKGGAAAQPATSTDLANGVVTFSSEQLQRLKERTGATSRVMALNSLLLSELDSVQALSFPINLRERPDRYTIEGNIPLPAGYFGNGLYHCRIGKNQPMTLPSAEQVKQSLAWLNANVAPDQAVLGFGFLPTDLATSSWCGFDTAPDFDGQAPKLVLDSNVWPPGIIIFSDGQEKGSIDVRMALSRRSEIEALWKSV